MYKEQETVIRELRKLFNVADNLNNGTTESNGKFHISKKQLPRIEVLNSLVKYFKGVGVKDGYVQIGDITFIHTTFEVKNGIPDKFKN